MKGFAQTGAGNAPELMVLHTDLPVPEVRARDVLIRVLGAATNPVDGKVRKRYDKAAKLIVGFDGSGVVEKLGADVKGFIVGEEVFFAGDVSRAGCFAQFVAVDHRIVARKPKSLDHATAATIPLCALTVYEGFVDCAGVTSGLGKSLLVVAGAGGVGSLAIQYAKKVLGFDHVIATASRPETVEFVKKMGADHAIDHTKDMKEQLTALGFQKGVDVVYNCAEADENFDAVCAVAAPNGHIILITGMAKQANITQLFSRRVSLHYEFMFSRILLDEEPERQGQVLALFARLVDQRVIDPRATQRLAASDIPKALAIQDSGKAIGKLSIDLSEWHK